MKINNKSFSLPVIYIITFVLATCSLLYELLIAHTIATLAANTVIWYSVTIGLFLGSLGFGSILYKIFTQKNKLLASLFKVEIALSLIGLLSSLLIYWVNVHSIHSMLTYKSQNSLFLFFGTGCFFILIIGFLTGIELPLLFDIANEKVGENKKISNRILAMDYLGSLCASILFPIILLPNMKIIEISFLIASLNLFMASLIFIKAFSPIFKRKNIIYIFLIIFLANLLFIANKNSLAIEQYYLQRFYYPIDAKELSEKNYYKLPAIERYSSPYQKIDFVRIPKSEQFRDFKIIALMSAYTGRPIEEFIKFKEFNLYLNRDFQFSSLTEVLYHEYFAHIPILISNQIPKEVLVIGGGDGLLIRELLKYKNIQNITHVDIDEVLVNLAKTHYLLKKVNANSLTNPRVKTIITDGLVYLRKNKKKYDAIYIGCTFYP